MSVFVILRRSAIWLLAALGSQLSPGQAQQPDCNCLTTTLAVPMPGPRGSEVGLNAGGPVHGFSNDRPLLRPICPSPSQWGATLSYDSWDNRGVRIVGGSRRSANFSYARCVAHDQEVAVNLPYHHLRLDTFGTQSGLGDLEVAWRKYHFDATDEKSLTIVYSLRAFLPTGSTRRGTGLGKLGYGPMVTLAKPVGSGRTLLYGGAGLVVNQDVAGTQLSNSNFLWAGAVTRLAPRWSLQGELLGGRSPQREQFRRVLAGPVYRLAADRDLTLSLSREFKADGRQWGASCSLVQRF